MRLEKELWRADSKADAPHQGERPQFCCQEYRDSAAQLEVLTLAENQHRKKKSESEKGNLYAKNQVHIDFAGAVNAADSAGICFFFELYRRI